MKRKMTEMLIRWKNDPRRKPLILEGARQTGKSFLVSEFGKNHYDDVAYFDLEKSQSAAALFEGNIDPTTIVSALSLLHGKPIIPGKTLIVLDEAQGSARALTSLKYFCEDAPNHHVVATGSLLGIAVSRKRISYPVGKVNTLTLYPLDFEEYLWALDKTILANYIREVCTAKTDAMPLHDRAMELYRSYLVVGGMPEAVAFYAQSREMTLIRQIQEDILTAYIADITKYAEASETVRILDAYRSLPAQLLKENRKFKYSQVVSGGRSSRFLYPLAWLEAARITLRCTEATEGFAPLMVHLNPDAFKLYMSDVGLLCSRYEVNSADIMGDTLTSTLFKGALAENYVMQHLSSAGYKPAYWGRPTRAEVDFIITDTNGDVIPLEVKSGTNVQSKSLGIFMQKYQCPYAIRLSAKNFGATNNIRSIPLYAAFCL